MTEQLYTYDIPSLRGGDILLSTTSQRRSRIIRAVTRSPFSHAMLYTNRSIIHAEAGGVFSTNPQRRLFSKTQSKVLRLRQPHSTDLQSVCDFATGLVGALYTVPEAILAALLHTTGQAAFSPSQYCSRLVAQAYEHGGQPIVANADFCAPGHFERCALLEEVPGAIRPANAEEIELSRTVDTAKVHQTHTFAWLEPTRKLARMRFGVQIVSKDEALQLVAKHPDVDEVVAEFIEESGYLTDYLMDRELSPHRYNLESFRRRLAQYSGDLASMLTSEYVLNRDHVANALPQFKHFSGSQLKVHTLLANMHLERLLQTQVRLKVLRIICVEQRKPLLLGLVSGELGTLETALNNAGVAV